VPHVRKSVDRWIAPTRRELSFNLASMRLRSANQTGSIMAKRKKQSSKVQKKQRATVRPAKNAAAKATKRAVAKAKPKRAAAAVDTATVEVIEQPASA
jgi:hypothetical protein